MYYKKLLKLVSFVLILSVIIQPTVTTANSGKIPKESTPAVIKTIGESCETAGMQSDCRYRWDGYTDDTAISSSQYSANKEKYYYLFKMGLAGPGRTGWDYATGKGVNVAIIDSGANVNHYDLKANVKGCYNSATKTESKSAVNDTDGHGTKTAGILAAKGNNRRLSAGIAYNANLYVIKAAINDSTHAAYTASVIEGIRYAVKKKCRVVSMSFGDGVYDQALKDAIDQAYKQTHNSILFVAAGGNTGKQEYHYPASYDNCLSVSALTYEGGQLAISSKSTYNGRMDIAAPGKSLYTLSNKSNSAAAVGGATSAAAPYAAGVAALIFQANPSLTAAQCADILTTTATDAGTVGYDRHYGYGRIDPLKAVQKAVYKTNSRNQVIKGLSASYNKTYQSKPFTLKGSLSGSGVLKYTSGSPKVAAVTSSGKVTVKKIGRATITAAVSPSGIFKSAKKKITLTVTPKTGKILTAKNVKPRAIKLSWSKDKAATGYQIRLAANSKFKAAKSYVVKKNSTSSTTITKLKNKKSYYIQVRSYKTVNGKPIYGPYSKAKKVKIVR